MKTFLLAAALFALPAFALDGGSVDVVLDVVDAGAVVAPAVSPVLGQVVDAGVPFEAPAATDLVKTIFTGVKTGNWWLVAGAFLVLVVSILRSSGKKFHEWLPDNNILDKPLFFLFDTRVGGWILNWLTAMAGGIGTALVAGVTVDFSLWKSVVMVSTSASAIFELYSDIMAWVKTKTAAKKEAAAKAAADAALVAAKAVAAQAATLPTPVEPPKP